jgi:hypothetical protein
VGIVLETWRYENTTVENMGRFSSNVGNITTQLVIFYQCMSRGHPENDIKIAMLGYPSFRHTPMQKCVDEH